MALKQYQVLTIIHIITLYVLLSEANKVDMIVINSSSWSLVPIHDWISSLVYCMRSENIISVMCNCRWIMKNKKIMNVDEAEIISNAKHAASQLLKRAGIQIPNKMNLEY